MNNDCHSLRTMHGLQMTHEHGLQVVCTVFVTFKQINSCWMSLLWSTLLGLCQRMKSNKHHSGTCSLQYSTVLYGVVMSIMTGMSVIVKFEPTVKNLLPTFQPWKTQTKLLWNARLEVYVLQVYMHGEQRTGYCLRRCRRFV